MTAPQNAWAKPLGQQLVSLFRETNVWYISNVSGSYDPLTGNVGFTPSRIYHCGAAVLKKLLGYHAAFTAEGFGAGSEAYFWFDGTTLPVEPDTSGFVWYQGGLWSLIAIDPILHSDGTFYAYKVRAAHLGDFTYHSSDPPTVRPEYAGLPVIETLAWTPDGKAPGQIVAPTSLPAAQLRWGTVPSSPLNPVVNTAATGTDGVAAGGTGPYTYQEQWEISPDGANSWQAIPTATGLTYTPSATDAGKWIRLHVTVTDSASPAAKLEGLTVPGQIGQAPITQLVAPTIGAATAQVGTALTATQGSATGGVGALSYADSWEISPDGISGWVPVAADVAAGGAALPLQYTPKPADAGKFLRHVTTASDSSTPTPHRLAMPSVALGSVLAVGEVPLTQQTAPTVTGNLITGAVLTAAGAAATGGTGAITYGYRWQHAKTAAGPWTDIPGATAATYTVAAGMVGELLRAVARATDSGTPTPHRLDIPSAPTTAIGAHLSRNVAPVLPATAPTAGTAFGPATAGTFKGGLAPTTIAEQWQVSDDGKKGWADIPGATGLSYTPTAAQAGKFLRLISKGTDSSTGAVAVDNPSLHSQAIGAATTMLCAAGEVTVRGVMYCSPTTWTHKLGGYNPLTGDVADQQWVEDPGPGSTNRTPLDPPQITTPTLQLTYGPVQGVAADWRESPKETWHNLRTGVWVEGLPSNPGTTGLIIAPSPVRAITTVHQPTPLTGTWKQLAPLVTGGIPRWEHTGTGQVLTQWGDPTVIGAAGASVLVWLGTGPDPWVLAADGTWGCSATGQVWPADGSKPPAGRRPQPDDTATIPRPAASIPSAVAGVANPTYDPWVQLPRVSPVSWWNYVTRQEVHRGSHPRIEQWVRSGAVPARTPSGAGTWQLVPAGDPLFDPMNARWRHIATGAVVVQIGDPGVQGVDDRNTIVAVGTATAAAGPGGPGSGSGGTTWTAGTLVLANTWTRQTDGLQLVQALQPDLPIDGPDDWWESPTGTWHSLLRPEIYVQPLNPGLDGNTVPVTAAVPVGLPSDWTVSGAGTTASPFVWARTLPTPQRVQQPVNPGIGGIIGRQLLSGGTAPVISGNVRVGRVLRATVGDTVGGQAPLRVTEQWQRSPDGTTGWADISGATGHTYTPVAGDQGRYLRLHVTTTDSSTPAQSVTTTSNTVGPLLAAAAALTAGTVPAPTAAPAGFAVGHVVTATAGTTTGGTGTVTHVAALQQAPARTGPWTAAPGTLTAAMVGNFLRTEDVATDGSTPAETVTQHSAVVGPVVAALTAGTPTLSGSFTVAPGTATGGTAPITTTQTWARGAAATGPWTAIAGATGTSYTPGAADAGMFIQCTVTYTDSGTPAQSVTASVASATAQPGGRTVLNGITFGATGTWTGGGVFDPLSGTFSAPYTFTGPGGATIVQPFDINPATPAPFVGQDPNKSWHGFGVPGEWTRVIDTGHVGRPAYSNTNGKWTNSRTGQVLWQIDNPAAPLPPGSVYNPLSQNYDAPPAAPGGMFMVGGFMWRSPDTWHWDATHLVWINDRTGELTSQQGNAGMNPHTVPTAADTGPFVLNGIHYAETNAPPTITWRQDRPGVWQRLVNGSPNGAPLNQVQDPRAMPA